MKTIDRLKSILGPDNFAFLKHGKNYLTGEFFSKGLTFLSIPIVTRLLSPSEYGLLSIFNTLIFILIVFTSLNFPAAIKRLYFEKEIQFNEALGTSLISMFGMQIILITIYYFLRLPVSSVFNIPVIILDFAMIVSILMSIIQTYQQYLQAIQNSFRYSLIAVSLNGVTLVLGIGIILNLAENKYMGLVYSRFSVVLVMSVIILFFLLKITRFTLRKSYLRYLLKFGIPLIPHSLSGFILAFFDRIIIQQLTSSSETGLYSFAYNIGMLMNTIVISLNNSWVPMFYKLMNEKRYDRIEQMIQNYAKYIFTAALLLILFTKDIVVIMADRQYYSSFDIIPVIVMSYVVLFLYTIFSNYIFYSKKTYIISLNTLIAASVNIGLNYWLIPVYGYKIAAVTTFISYLGLFLFHYSSVRILMREHSVFKIRKILISGFIFLIFLLISIGFLFIDLPLFTSILLKFTILILIILTFFPKLRELFL